MRYVIAFFSYLAFPSYPAFAIYNENVDSQISSVIVYDYAKFVFSISTNDFVAPPCASPGQKYFFIDGALPEDIRAQILSRLLTAKAMGETIRIGYDGMGNCSDGNIRVHRVW